jgi:hypothetical protein
VLLKKDGQQVFQHKQEIVVATPDKLETLSKFKTDLHALLRCASDEV